MNPAESSGGGRRSAKGGAVLAGALLVAGVGYGLGGYPLLEPDEGRNAEVAREMVASGDYLVPHLDGLPYLDKPVLFFAADAAAQAAFGVSEAPARLPSLLFALATAALTGWFGRRLFGGAAGWIAAVAALAAPLPVVFARTVIFDSALTFFMVLALAAFYEAIERARPPATSRDGRRVTKAPEGAPDAEKARHRAPDPGKARDGAPGGAPGGWRRWTVLAWAAMGLGVLTKGPVALAIPLLAAVPYAVYRRASRAVWHAAGPAALLAVVAPWIWVMSRQVPEFLHYALVTETWGRLTTDELRRTGPFWYFIPLLLAGALPWSAVVLGSARRSLRLRTAGGPIDGRRLYLLLWIALPFVLFSLSHSKRPQYILPLAPAVAMLAAAVWAGEGAGAPPAGARAAAATWLVLGGLLAIAAPILAGAPRALPSQATLLPRTLLALGLALAGSGLLAWLGAARPWFALAALALPMAALPAVAMPALRQVASERSSRDLAAAIAPHLAAGAVVVGVRAFPPSLPFYLQQRLLVTSGRGRELTSNYVIEYYAKWIETGDTPLRPPTWWRAALARCERPWIFVTWSDDRESRALLEASGIPPLAVTARHAAYGPCRSPARSGAGRPTGHLAQQAADMSQ